MTDLQSIVNRHHALAMVKERGCISYPSEWEEVAAPEDWDAAYLEDVALLLRLLRVDGRVPDPTIPVLLDVEECQEPSNESCGACSEIGAYVRDLEVADHE